MALTQDQINAIYAKRRTKGGYVEKLTELMKSDENGASVKDTWPEYASKPATTLYQGFRNAAEKMGATEVVDVINSDGEVFVIIKDRVAVIASENGNGAPTAA